VAALAQVVLAFVIVGYEIVAGRLMATNLVLTAGPLVLIPEWCRRLGARR
jgi:hypothetical protein